jgi:hypothetical protein
VDWFYARIWHSPEERPTKTTTVTRVLLAIKLENEAVVKLAVENVLVDPRTAHPQWMYEVTFQDVKTGKSMPRIPFWCHPGETPGTTPDYEPTIEEIKKQVRWLQARKKVK